MLDILDKVLDQETGETERLWALPADRSDLLEPVDIIHRGLPRREPAQHLVQVSPHYKTDSGKKLDAVTHRKGDEPKTNIAKEPADDEKTKPINENTGRVAYSLDMKPLYPSITAAQAGTSVKKCSECHQSEVRQH